jgi:serine/threonine protein kinase
MVKKRPALLASLDLSLVNKEAEECTYDPDYHMGITTYRHEGVSIGRDYLRFEGATISRGELLPSSLTLQGTIGRGSCSIVEKAVWKPPKNPEETQVVALKQFPLEARERRDMLIKELRALCEVDCDCLVKLMGAFLDQDNVTLVLEYMNEGSLNTVLQEQMDGTTRRFSNPVLASISYQMLWGLSYLHFERMIHRDVKPANILMNSQGYVKLSDFGIVAIQTSLPHTTVVGTIRYMSPERLRARPYGSSSDLWSLGLVLLECEIGESPWADITSMIDLVMTIEDESIEEYIPETTEEGMRELLLACLQKEQEKRVPASILLESPWFESHGIHEVSDAVAIMHRYFQESRNNDDVRE